MPSVETSPEQGGIQPSNKPVRKLKRLDYVHPNLHPEAEDWWLPADYLKSGVNESGAPVLVAVHKTESYRMEGPLRIRREIGGVMLHQTVIPGRDSLLLIDLLDSSNR